MSDKRFLLTIRVSVEECAEYPPGSGNWQPVGRQGLEVSDSYRLGSVEFLEAAEILGRFHRLGEEYR